jgi:hypothetical protein
MAGSVNCCQSRFSILMLGLGSRSLAITIGSCYARIALVCLLSSEHRQQVFKSQVQKALAVADIRNTLFELVSLLHNHINLITRQSSFSPLNTTVCIFQLGGSCRVCVEWPGSRRQQPYSEQDRHKNEQDGEQ